MLDPRFFVANLLEEELDAIRSERDAKALPPD